MPPLPRIAPISLLERSLLGRTSFIFELKYDSFRAVAYIERGNAKLVSRQRQHLQTLR